MMLLFVADRGSLPQTSCEGHDQYHAQRFTIGKLLETFMFFVCGCEVVLCVRPRMCIENSDVKEGTFKTASPKAACGDIYTLAPSSTIAEAPNNTSPDKAGSVATLSQTSDRRFAVRSRTSLCLVIGKLRTFRA